MNAMNELLSDNIDFSLPSKFEAPLKRGVELVKDDGERTVVLLVGSLAFGNATDDSDIDILVVSDTTDVKFRPYEEATIDESGIEVNIIYTNFAAVESLLSSFKSSVKALTGAEGSFHRFTEADRRLLHRIAKGVVLSGHNAMKDIRKEYMLDSLNLYLCYYYLVGFFAYISKARKKGHTMNEIVGRSMLDLAGYRMMGAILASIDETHPEQVWRPFLINKHASSLTHEEVSECLRILIRTDDAGFDSELARFEEFSKTAIAHIAGRSEAMGQMVSYLLAKEKKGRIGQRLVGRA